MQHTSQKIHNHTYAQRIHYEIITFEILWHRHNESTVKFRCYSIQYNKHSVKSRQVFTIVILALTQTIKCALYSALHFYTVFIWLYYRYLLDSCDSFIHILHAQGVILGIGSAIERRLPLAEPIPRMIPDKTSLAICFELDEATWNVIDKSDRHQTATKHNKAWLGCIILGIFSGNLYQVAGGICHLYWDIIIANWLQVFAEMLPVCVC